MQEKNMVTIDFNILYFRNCLFTNTKIFVLRNAGGDMQGAHIRDAYSTQLTKESGVAFQEYRPVVVYINGKYWGIYSLREKINEHFIHDQDRKSTRLNSSHVRISYAVFCLKK